MIGAIFIARIPGASPVASLEPLLCYIPRVWEASLGERCSVTQSHRQSWRLMRISGSAAASYCDLGSVTVSI